MRRVLKWVSRGLIVLLVIAGGFWAWGMPGSDLRGVWKAEWGGNYLRLTPFTAEILHANAADCTSSMTFPAHLPLISMAEGAEIERDGEDLVITISGTLDDWRFSRAEALPEPCKRNGADDPGAVFDMMWSAMDEHYAFFDLHGVDWSARRDLSAQAEAADTDQALFDTIVAALDGLEDGHIQLIAPGIGFHSPEPPAPWIEGQSHTMTDLRRLAVSTFGGEMQSFGEVPLRVGVRADGIGYLNLSGMWLDTAFGTTELDAAELIAEQVARVLAPARAIIVDVRHNGGGSDGVAFAYASVFADTERVVLRKRSKIGDGWTDWTDGILTPHATAPTLNQPVILLTSDVTASAAEIFTMALRELPQVTVMGEPTGGGLSDILGITLPNGWAFGLSNQEYVTADGTLFEKVGVPPDFLMTMDGDDLAAGRDAVLEAALAELAE